MAFTPEQRAKAAATRATRKAEREAKAAAKAAKAAAKTPAPVDETSFSKLASVGTSAETEAALRAQIADLHEKLGVEKKARSAAEAAALAAAESQTGLLQPGVEEVPTGNVVKVKRGCGYEVKGYHDDGREILRPIYETVERPTFFYRIDMPGCGGAYLGINGVNYYHGATYELDLDTLRTVKEMVYRLWDHDRQIHGSDENFYRAKHMNADPRNRMSARGMH